MKCDYALKPSAELLAKLGSIIVHAQEFISPDRHEFDLAAMEQGLTDPQVKEWLAAMTKMAFVPVKRKS